MCKFWCRQYRRYVGPASARAGVCSCVCVDVMFFYVSSYTKHGSRVITVQFRWVHLCVASFCRPVSVFISARQLVEDDNL